MHDQQEMVNTIYRWNIKLTGTVQHVLHIAYANDFNHRLILESWFSN